MARNKKTTKAKEPIRLRMKDLSNGSKSLYLDIYRDGKRSYEYLKMYIVPETDENSRRQNQATLVASNKIKADRIIELTNGEAGIKQTKDELKIYLLDWMQTYKENQAKRGKKDGPQISTAIKILKMYAGEKVTMDMIDKPFCQGYIDYLLTEYKPKASITGLMITPPPMPQIAPTTLERKLTTKNRISIPAFYLTCLPRAKTWTTLSFSSRSTTSASLPVSMEPFRSHSPISFAGFSESVGRISSSE